MDYMGYNVVLKKGTKDVLNFWVEAFTTAQNAVISHLAGDRNNRATITNINNGDYNCYYWVGDKLNISTF